MLSPFPTLLKLTALWAVLAAAAPVSSGQTVKPPTPAPAKTPAARTTAPALPPSLKTAPATSPKAKNTAQTPPSKNLSEADRALLQFAEKKAKTLSPAQTARLLERLNKGTAETLQSLPGIGEVKAQAIRQGRPFATVSSLILVHGIGEKTFEDIIAFAKTPATPVKP